MTHYNSGRHTIKISGMASLNFKYLLIDMFIIYTYMYVYKDFM